MVFAILFVLALAFVLYPLMFGAQQATKSSLRSEHNKRVHAEQLADLQNQLDSGHIDQAHFLELQNELLSSVLLASGEEQAAAQRSVRSGHLVSVTAVFLLVAIAASYVWLGYYKDLQSQRALEQFGQRTATDGDNRAALLVLLESIRGRVDARPGNLGWRYLLAQMQSELKRHADAAENYSELLESDNNNAELWAHYGQALYLDNARRMSPEIDNALQSALRINPHQRTALGLIGMHAFEEGEFAKAASTWEKLLGGMQPNTQQHSLINNARNAALTRLAEQQGKEVEVRADDREDVGSDAETSVVDVPAAKQSEVGVDSISVQVTLSEGLSLPSSDSVFIYARAANGPKMPLAIVRLKVSDLPTQVQLHDGLAMMPAMKLSMFDDIEIIARISAKGTAAAAPGDWQASSGILRRDSISETVVLDIADQI
ncbi:MAG: c-type cytochrome biogenesis protein CcmI [Pseudomonadales bacterium]